MLPRPLPHGNMQIPSPTSTTTPADKYTPSPPRPLPVNTRLPHPHHPNPFSYTHLTASTRLHHASNPPTRQQYTPSLPLVFSLVQASTDPAHPPPLCLSAALHSFQQVETSLTLRVNRAGKKWPLFAAP